MTLATAWILLPLVLSVLSLGCGLLLETVSGMRLPGALLLPGGFIIISLATQFAHMLELTAGLQTPLVIVLALTGYGVARPWTRFRLDYWLTGAVAAVYAVFAAPVVLTGQATFLGYIKLDDTAFYQAMLDRASAHAYNVPDLSHLGTYRTVLFQGYKFGYPLGAFLPLDIGQTLTRVDTAWLWQPYLAFLSLLTALGLYQLASGMVESRVLRACVAFFGAQAALIYGYFLWGGVKELFLPSVILFAACLIPLLRHHGPRQVIPLGAASAAVLGAWSVGGGIWVVPLALAGLAVLITSTPVIDVAKSAGVYLLSTLLLAIPILSVSEKRLGVPAKFRNGNDASEIGNLIHPLSWLQTLGVWIGGDFRKATGHALFAHLLMALVVVSVIAAAVFAVRRKRWEIITVLGAALFACLVYVERASPWVGGKALASSSPLIFGVGLIGLAVAIETAWKQRPGLNLALEPGLLLAAVGAVLLALIGAGVLWSNASQYHMAFVAPSARLMELETIGHKFAGQGPGLLTEYEPYAARHFLRGLNAEEPAELRPHYIYLRSGHWAATGVSPDTDEMNLRPIKFGDAGILYYHTLIIRRTGVASRPPSSFNLVWHGRWYDVWQQSPNAPHIIEHLSLGDRYQPAAVPNCADVLSLARKAAAAHGMLAAVPRPPAIVIQPRTGHIGPPKEIYTYGEPIGNVYEAAAYKSSWKFSVPSSGRYGIWVGGSFNSSLTVKVDGQKTGSGFNQLAWPGNYLNFGSIYLTKGKHDFFWRHGGPDWHPGTALIDFGLGPFVVAKGNDQSPIVKVKPRAAHSLCGKSLDWVEALAG
jgi:hypothetical protein